MAHDPSVVINLSSISDIIGEVCCLLGIDPNKRLEDRTTDELRALCAAFIHIAGELMAKAKEDF